MASASNTDLPSPASPRTTSARLRPRRASAPGGALRTIVVSDGVRGGYEPDAGDEAVLQARITVGHDGSFTAVGSIIFGVRHVMRFRTLGNGRLARTPDRHLRQGGAVA